MSEFHLVPSAPVLEVRDLRLVHAIAGAGGVARAARTLHLTQSALSHHLRALEDRLGVTLFDRVGRRLALNDRGSRLVALADRVLPELVEAEIAVRAPSAPPQTFRLTMGCYTTYPWLPALLERLRRELPGTRCDVVVEATRRASQAVLEGEVDAAIVPLYARDERFVVRPAFTEDIVVVTRPDDALAERDRIPIRALAGRTVLAHDLGAQELAWYRRALGKDAPLLRHVVPIPLTEAMIELVRSGVGVALLGSWAVARELQRRELVARPLRPQVRRKLAVITARTQTRDPRAELLASVLAAEVARAG